ncbi:MAG: tRNA (guanine(46)-N(7))-methyltransferase TrmB [Pseudomonadota bacterium]
MSLDPPDLAGPKGWPALFPDGLDQLWLEVGFGSGEHLSWQIGQNKTAAFIGCEPFINGMAALLSGLPEADRPRLRLYGDDGLDILRHLPDGALSRCFILFPDPWPKRRHANRRFIRAETVPHIARTLRPGGELRVGSDDPTMIDWALMHLCAESRLHWQVSGSKDWLVRPDDWPATRYEQKAIQSGRTPVFLRFLRGE